MSGLAERIRARQCSNDPVTVDGETFLIAGLSRRERSEIQAKCRDRRKGVLDPQRLEDALLVRCVLDPTSGKSVFATPAEWAEVPAEITGPLMSAIMKKNGFDEADLGKSPDSTGETSTDS